MDRKEFKDLFRENLYRIPDYQRGYAWREKQWNDFIEDIDAIADEEERVSGHYTGTIVVFGERNAPRREYGTLELPVLDVVDGQQRLTTACIYLSVIIRALLKLGADAYAQDRENYLFTGETSRLTLGNDTNNIFLDLLKNGRTNTEPSTPHEVRLVSACRHFQAHVDGKLAGGRDIKYLKKLFQTITQKLHFTFYRIEEEHEVGMTFELMNSRGKELSVLELLKNYLMHWVSRNVTKAHERRAFTDLINNCWRDVYRNLGNWDGEYHEQQCLRIAWIMYCTHTPKYWKGYEGFKGDAYIPLRKFKDDSHRQAVGEFGRTFMEGLAEISRLYALVMRPEEDSSLTEPARLWLTKLHNAENIANFLPLMVAARRQLAAGEVGEAEYVAHLQSLECFAYRVFLYGGKRSNAGRSTFFKYGSELFNGIRSLESITRSVHALVRHYAAEHQFRAELDSPDNWYKTRRCLKYTLYEYELHLLAGKGKPLALKWADLSDSTIEHILPQQPKPDSDWRRKWSEAEFEECLHDIGNLVLTHDNSAYQNFEFQKKKGEPGRRPSYADSDIRQERRLAVYSDWTPKEFGQRRAELVAWIKDRWKTESPPSVSAADFDLGDLFDDADDDAPEIKEVVS